MNDHDRCIVARNAILLLLMATVNDTEILSECVLHLWYSAFIRQVDLDLLHRRVLPLVQDVCENIKNCASTLHVKKWQFGNTTLHFVLEEETWQKLLSYLTIRNETTLPHARHVRRTVTNCPELQDERDRDIIRQNPEHRVCMTKLVEDGILLPFAHSREAFVIPNP